MATRAEYKAQGYTDQQINDAIAKKSKTVQQSAGPNAPLSAQPVTNPNLVPMAAAPVAPVAPVSPDIAPAMREGTAANPVSQAPVAQPVQTPQAAPVSPDIAPSERPGTAAVAQPAVAPVVAPKVEAVAKKTTAPKVAAAQAVNYDSSVGRDQEILANLSEGYKNAPDLFADEATFRASYGYATADEGKKRMLDAFYQAKQPKNEDQFFSILASGGRVWNESSKALPAYQSAVKRFEDIQKYKGFTSSQFSSALSSGKIIPGSRVYKDLQNDPVAKVNMEKAVTLNRINGVGTNENKVRETVMSEIGTSPFGKAVADGFIDATEANALMTTPEIKAKQDQIEPLKNEYDRLKASYDDVETQVDEELKGTGATSSYRDALIGARRKNIYKNLQVATDTYNNAIGSLADMKKTQSDLLSTNLGLYKDQQAFQKQKELALYQQQLGLEGKQKEFEQQLAQKAAIAKDPVLATQDVIDQYRKLGVLAQRSDAEIVADVQAQVKAGKPLGSVLSELNRAFQSKPEYQRAQELKRGEMSDREKMAFQESSQLRQEAATFARQKEMAAFSKDLDRQNFLFQIENDPEKRAKAFELEQKIAKDSPLLALLGKNVATYEGNRGHDLAGKIGDPLPAGGDWEVVSIIDANYASSPYGNSVLMRDENGNTVRYSHLDSIGVKTGDKLSFGTIVGTRGNTGNVKGANGETLTKAQLQAGRGAHVDVEVKDSKGRLLSENEQKAYLSSKKPAKQFSENAIAISNGIGSLSDLTPTDKQKILPELNEIIKSRQTGDANRDKIVKSALYGKELSDSSLQKITDMQTVKTQLQNLETRLKKVNVGPFIGQISKMNPYDTEAQVALAELAGITPKVARGIFGEVGVLTDTDIANYQKTLPNLTSTEAKNALVVEFMRKLLAEGVKNAIATQAKGQRNMAEFLQDYDEADAFIKKQPSAQSVPQSFQDLYNNLHQETTDSAEPIRSAVFPRPL